MKKNVHSRKTFNFLTGWNEWNEKKLCSTMWNTILNNYCSFLRFATVALSVFHHEEQQTVFFFIFIFIVTPLFSTQILALLLWNNFILHVIGRTSEQRLQQPNEETIICLFVLLFISLQTRKLFHFIISFRLAIRFVLLLVVRRASRRNFKACQCSCWADSNEFPSVIQFYYICQ